MQSVKRLKLTDSLRHAVLAVPVPLSLKNSDGPANWGGLFVPCEAAFRPSAWNRTSSIASSSQLSHSAPQMGICWIRSWGSTEAKAKAVQIRGGQRGCRVARWLLKSRNSGGCGAGSTEQMARKLCFGAPKWRDDPCVKTSKSSNAKWTLKSKRRNRSGDAGHTGHAGLQCGICNLVFAFEVGSQDEGHFDADSMHISSRNATTGCSNTGRRGVLWIGGTRPRTAGSAGCNAGRRFLADHQPGEHSHPRHHWCESPLEYSGLVAETHSILFPLCGRWPHFIPNKCDLLAVWSTGWPLNTNKTMGFCGTAWMELEEPPSKQTWKQKLKSDTRFERVA